MVDVSNDAGFAWFFGKFGGGFNLGEHGAGFEITVILEVVDFFGGDFVDGLLIFGAVI